MEKYFPSEHLPMRNSDLEIQIGRMYKEAGDIEKYTKVLETLLMDEKTSFQDIFYIGQLYMQDLQDYEKAVKIFKNLNLEYPREFEIVVALVQAYSQSNQFEKAINLLNNWLKDNPNDPQALEYLNILKDVS